MKTISLLLVILILSFKLSAQDPTWIHSPYSESLKFSFGYYDLGYDEHLYASQCHLLKGSVKSCTIQEKVSLKDRMGVISYNMIYYFNKEYRIEKLDLNKRELIPDEPTKTELIRTESFSYIQNKLHLKSYWIENKCKYLLHYKYNQAQQIEQEQWSSLYKEEVIFYPFEVKYHYVQDGSYRIEGISKEDFGAEHGILRYQLEYNHQGQLVKRTIYNWLLAYYNPNDPNRKEVFEYQYDKRGVLKSMSYTGFLPINNQQEIKQLPLVMYCYEYTDEDVHGNWQTQKILDEKGKLLFEMERILEYCK